MPANIPVPMDFAASEPARLPGQGKPARCSPFPAGDVDIPGFVAAFFQNVWNRRMLGEIVRRCAPHIVLQGPTDRVYHGISQYRAFVLSMLAAFPDLAMTVEDLYWMGNESRRLSSSPSGGRHRPPTPATAFTARLPAAACASGASPSGRCASAASKPNGHCSTNSGC